MHFFKNVVEVLNFICKIKVTIEVSLICYFVVVSHLIIVQLPGTPPGGPAPDINHVGKKVGVLFASPFFILKVGAANFHNAGVIPVTLQQVRTKEKEAS